MDANEELRASLNPVNLDRLEEQFRGTEFRELVQEHVRKTGNLEIAIMGYLEPLHDHERKFRKLLIDDLTELAQSQTFWHSDTGSLFRSVREKLEAVLTGCGFEVDPRIIFAIFNIAVLGFAMSARDDKEFRKFAGIKKGIFFT